MLGMHLTFSAYGFWPANDPRGSGSSRVRAQRLYEVGGEATKITTRQSVAARPHDRRLTERIKRALKYPPVVLSGVQARAVGRGVGVICPKIDLVVYALAILPDHVHLVVGAHPFEPEELIACLQRAATRQLNNEDLNPMKRFPGANSKLPSPWTTKGWPDFLDTRAEMQAAIQYVEMNPVRAGLPLQRWSCVAPYVESPR